MRGVPVILQLALRHTIDDPRVCHKIAASLADRYHVELIAEDARTGEIEPGVTCHVHRDTGFADFFSVLPLIRRIRPDVIHCHDPVSFVVGVIAKLFRRRCKLIFDVHEMYETFDTSGLPYSQKLFLEAFNRVFVPVFGRIADAFILVIPEQEPLYRRFGKPLEIIYNFPRLDQFFAGETPSDSCGKTYTMFYGGRIHEARGAIEYLKILGELIKDDSSARLLMVGPITEETRNQIGKYIGEHDLGNSVTILDRVSQSEMKRYINESRVGLNFLSDMPNHNFGIQNKVFEYMACGVPVLGTKNLVHFEKMVVEERCGIAVEYGNTAEAAEAVRQILSDYESFSSNCLKAAHKYSWDNETGKLTAFYEMVISG